MSGPHFLLRYADGRTTHVQSTGDPEDENRALAYVNPWPSFIRFLDQRRGSSLIEIVDLRAGVTAWRRPE